MWGGLCYCSHLLCFRPGPCLDRPTSWPAARRNGVMLPGPRRDRIVGVVVGYALLISVAAVFLVPLLFMLVASLKPDLDVLAESNSLKAFWPGRLENNYFEAFITSDFTRIFLNSVIITWSYVALATLTTTLPASTPP